MENDRRIVSLDTLRGLVILLMIFVNDLAGVRTAPGWLKHVDAKADAMTLPDIVFPAFLFIAGMSIPLAMQGALIAGQSRWQLLIKVLKRTLSMLVMGVIMVNMETHNPGVRGLWGILAYLAFFMAFPVVPSSQGLKRRILQIGRIVGAVMLIILVWVYRTQDGKTHAQRLRWTCLFAVGLGVAALLFDPLYGINKIQATPTWCLLCASLTALTWAGLYSKHHGCVGTQVLVRDSAACRGQSLDGVYTPPPDPHGRGSHSRAHWLL